MMFKNITKKILTGMLALSLVVGGVVIVPSQAKAADRVTVADEAVAGVVWAEYTKAEFETFWTEAKKTVPSYDGTIDGDYVFGGWYTDKKAAVTEAKKAESCAISVGDVVDQNTVYARFVPAYVLSMKAQNRYKETGTAQAADMRLVSSVDCLDYSDLGFEVKINNKTDLTTGTTKKVFSELKVKKDANTSTNFTADKLFGDAAKFSFTWALTGIKSANYDKIVYAKPFWVTKDGTKVYGLAKYAHINDSINNIINIPISVYEAKQIAAGVLTVDYPEDKITFLEKEVDTNSRVFGEAEVADKDGKIKCVGNVKDITADATSDADLYINLRFKAVEGKYAGVGSGFLNFTVDGEDFCDKEEQTVPVDAWNVQY